MILVYRYGLLPPTVGGELVDAQMLAAHRYRNTLTAIERDRRAAVREILGAVADVEALQAGLAEIETQLEAARNEIRAHRSRARARAEGVERREALRALAAEAKARRAEIKTVKTRIAADPEIRARLDAADERAAQRRREERARCGVYWGTYLLVEASADQARKAKIDPAFTRSTHDPDLVEIAGRELWLDEGRVGVQIQGGMSADELESDRRLQILHAPDRRTGRRAGTRRVLRVRIGSDDAGGPIWADWPMIMHRALPPAARIKGAVVSRRRADRRRWEWSVEITIDAPDRAARPAPSSDAVALNLGWCQTERGLRAGYMLGSDGAEMEIEIPPSIIERVEKSSAIESQRDQDLDEMRAVLLDWMRSRADDLPDWMRARCVLDRDGKKAWHVGQWRSADRFARLAQVWRARRFAGDDRGYDLLESWRYRDEHLERYARGMERGARRHRREIYRRAAAEAARRYRSLVVDDTDLRAMQRSPGEASERVELAAVKRQQQIVAPYELRLALVNAFRGAVDVLPAKDLTRRCHDCGHVDSWDRAYSDRVHACSACGATWDQDANACRNLLREWSATADDREAARLAKIANRKPTRTERFRAALKRKSESTPLET